MASDRASLVALRELIADTDLTLETIPDLPQNRTAHCRENLRAALALADDLIRQQRKTAAAILGHKAEALRPRNSDQSIIARWQLPAKHAVAEGRANKLSRLRLERPMQRYWLLSETLQIFLRSIN